MSNRFGIPQKTLQDRVRFLHVHDACKHGLNQSNETPEEYADAKINHMSQAEFLEAISNALEEMEKDRL